MKKTLLYLLAAGALGILVTVLPLITIAQVGIGGSTPQSTSLGKGLRQLDGGDGSRSSQVNSTDLTVLAVSFIIAFLAYALVGPRAPRRYNMRLGVPPH